ncbi:hypothetical protein ASPCAL07929 [Aspergillus calidoustus]|uniref:Uncharacterized protein n=1 Tax=Aspergillus calidoustus TaxID=454130 RepID=A0A0U5GVN0_ASPCI|nr:hypothetical protein ASPCAL07929 [Aspergillus calidoustus]
MAHDTPSTASQASPSPAAPINSSGDAFPPRPLPRDRTPPPSPPPPPIDPDSLPQQQKRVYTCLRTQGWTPQQCDIYFAKIPSRQQHIHLTLRHWDGWNEEQLRRFDQRCADEYVPLGLPPPDPEDDNIPVPNFWLNHRLLEDGNLRRRCIAALMYREMSDAERGEMEVRRQRELQARRYA